MNNIYTVAQLCILSEKNICKLKKNSFKLENDWTCVWLLSIFLKFVFIIQFFHFSLIKLNIYNSIFNKIGELSQIKPKEIDYYELD